MPKPRSPRKPLTLLRVSLNRCSLYRLVEDLCHGDLWSGLAAAAVGWNIKRRKENAGGGCSSSISVSAELEMKDLAQMLREDLTQTTQYASSGMPVK